MQGLRGKEENITQNAPLSSRARSGLGSVESSTPGGGRGLLAGALERNREGGGGEERRPLFLHNLEHRNRRGRVFRHENSFISYTPRWGFSKAIQSLE